MFVQVLIAVFISACVAYITVMAIKVSYEVGKEDGDIIGYKKGFAEGESVGLRLGRSKALESLIKKLQESLK